MGLAPTAGANQGKYTIQSLLPMNFESSYSLVTALHIIHVLLIVVLQTPYMVLMNTACLSKIDA